MGWGGRLVAACSQNIERYIGIDMNVNLKPHYDAMVQQLKTLSTTDIQLQFRDALTVDYSKLDYDFVFTSPPYYNVEIYNHSEKISKDEWNNQFYIPLFKMTYKHLKPGGVYCLNLPTYLYDIAKMVLGHCAEKYPLEKSEQGLASSNTTNSFMFGEKRLLE
jgi:site-specific DNA-adenine methylase